MKKSIDITILLDRSGSMHSLTDETISGFNEFIYSQRGLEAKITVTLVQFDHEYLVNYEAIEINKVTDLDAKTYVPRGSTALLDAIGKTIKLTQERHQLLKKKKRPDKTMLVIITDGYENSSTLYTKKRVFKKIKKMETQRGWEFIYLGANQDAIKVAADYGIEIKKTLSFAADSDGTKEMFHSVSKSFQRSIFHDKDFEFTEDQREKQKRD
jgi:uncharacterized protein YegL